MMAAAAAVFDCCPEIKISPKGFRDFWSWSIGGGCGGGGGVHFFACQTQIEVFKTGHRRKKDLPPAFKTCTQVFNDTSSIHFKYCYLYGGFVN